MKLFHTSTIEIQHPDIHHSRPFLDFGKGFYLTSLRLQAVRYGERFKRRNDVAILNEYEFDDIHPDCTYKFFETYDAEWLDFITACRRGMPHEIYDIIEGGIADDQVFDTIDLYFAGVINSDQALAELRFKKPNHQICITNQETINKYLHFLKSVQL